MKKILLLLLMLPVIIYGQTRLINLTSMTTPTGPPVPTVNYVITNALTFANVAGTPSLDITFTFTGSALTGSVTWTAGSGMQVSVDGSTWSTTAVYTQSGGVASGTVHNRVAGATAAGPYSGIVQATSPGLTGTVGPAWTATVSSTPTITLSPTSIVTNGVAGSAGAAASYLLSFVGVSGVTATSTAPVEISKDGGSTYALTQSVLTSGTTMKARVAQSATAQSISLNITHVASGATTQNEAVTGTVTSGSSDSVTFMFAATSTPTAPAGMVKVVGNPSAAIVTATGGLSNSITLTSVATGNWAPLSGTGCALDNGGMAGSTIPFMSSPALRPMWFNFSSSGNFADSTTLTMAKPQIIIGGLNPSLTYQVQIGSSLDSTQFALTSVNKFRIVGAATYISPLMNQKGNYTHPTAAEGPQFLSVTPNSSGQLKFYFFTEVGQEVTCINVMKVKQN